MASYEITVSRILQVEVLPTTDKNYSLVYSKFKDDDAFEFTVLESSRVKDIIEAAKTPKDILFEENLKQKYSKTLTPEIIKDDVLIDPGKVFRRYGSVSRKATFPSHYFYWEKHDELVFYPKKYGEPCSKDSKIYLADNYRNMVYDTKRNLIPKVIVGSIIESMYNIKKLAKDLANHPSAFFTSEYHNPINGRQLSYFIFLNEEEFRSWYSNHKNDDWTWNKFGYALVTLGIDPAIYRKT